MDLFQSTTITGGWNGSCAVPASANENWSSSPWENSSGKTWSQVTSKGVQQPAVRPKAYDSTLQSNWAGPQSVDQGTPWGSNADKAMKQNEYGTVNNWENGAKANSWQNPAQKNTKVSVSNNGADYWQKGTRSTSQSSQWNEPAAGGSGWDSLPPPSNRWNSDAPPACVPSNVWTGPPSAKDSVVDSSMIWNNPNPKKVVQPDKGTNVWGDPTSQNEIKRWKSNSDESGLASVGQQQSSTAGQQQLQTPSSSSSSVWQDSPIAPNGQKLSSTGWSDQPTGTQDGSSTAAPAANGTALWDADKTVPSSTWGGNNAWTSSNPNDSNRQSSGNLSAGVAEDGLCDDVFSSNPTTPLTPRGPLRNGTPSNLPANYSVVAQLTQQQPTQATGRPMQSNQQLQTLSKHIADQLRSAVQAGMIDISILCQPLSQESLLQLNQLLQIVPKLEQAQNELQSLQSLQRQGERLNETQSQEVKRLTDDVSRYSFMIQQIKQQINNKTRQSSTNMPNGSSSDVLAAVNGADPALLGSQSKLMQWSKNAGNGVDQKLSVSSSAPNLEHLEQNMTSLALGSAASNAVGDLWSNKRHSGSDWPTTNDSNKNESSSESLLMGWGRGDGQTDDSRQSFPPEFKPGHPWEWRDPNKIAEDPNATPGSVKPSALSKLNFDSTGFPNFPNLPNANYGVQSSFFGSTTPTKSNFDIKPSAVSPSFNADQFMPRYSRPPSQMGQPFGGRPPMIKQQPFAAPNNFMPYASNVAHWVVLTNLSQIDERSLQATVNRFGTTTTVVSPPGSGFVFLKFLESSFERLLPRMQQELAPYGVTVQIMKESEVERLLHVLNNRSASTMFTNNSSVHLPPPPPSVLWDGPPPLLGANTGVHPFAAPEMPPAQDAAAALAQQVMPPMHLNQIVM